ncbi:reverse transcriptase domain-containing protein, partial [Tanacetum coccineum]
MFNSTLTESARVWFYDLPPESIDSYDDLKKAFLANYLQQKKCIKDPVEIHHIKQRERESTEDFIQRFKVESRHVKGASECMRISGFGRGGGVQSSLKENASGMEATGSREKEKFRQKGRLPEPAKAPPPMTTLVEKRNNIKFCEFHEEVGHTTGECMHLKRQIEEMIKAKKLSHVIKELKQGKDQPKTNKKGKTSNKDKPLVILMVQPWQRVARQRITQSFSPDPEISFPPLEEEGT